MPRAIHPGKTPAQRRALDAIGCGDFTPPMPRSTRDALIKAGLIVQRGYQEIGRDRFGAIALPVFEMTIPAHFAWCQYQAENCDEEA